MHSLLSRDQNKNITELRRENNSAPDHTFSIDYDSSNRLFSISRKQKKPLRRKQTVEHERQLM